MLVALFTTRQGTERFLPGFFNADSGRDDPQELQLIFGKHRINLIDHAEGTDEETAEGHGLADIGL